MSDGAPGNGLRDLHLARGADYGPLPGGGEGVRRFGEVAAEYASLTEGCALIDRAWTGLVEVTGEDRRRFLNGLATRNIQTLEPGQGVYGFFTQQKGQVLSDAVIRALGSSIRLETAPGRAEDLAEHISRYVVADRVEIGTMNRLLPLTLAGPGAASVLATLPISIEGTTSVAEFLRDDARWRHTAIELLGRKLGLSADGHLGVPAFSFWVAAEQGADLWDGLLELGHGQGVVPAGYVALDRVRIASGVPWFGRDFDTENLPQESGLEGAVDYEKGCYLGQEVVARLHFRGQANRMVRRVGVEPGPSVRVGAALLLEDREAGRLTSLGLSSGDGPTPGLAMVQRRAMDAGSRLATEDGTRVEVLAPPTEL